MGETNTGHDRSDRITGLFQDAASGSQWASEQVCRYFLQDRKLKNIARHILGSDVPVGASTGVVGEAAFEVISAQVKKELPSPCDTSSIRAMVYSYAKWRARDYGNIDHRSLECISDEDQIADRAASPLDIVIHNEALNELTVQLLSGITNNCLSNAAQRFLNGLVEDTSSSVSHHTELFTVLFEWTIIAAFAESEPRQARRLIEINDMTPLTPEGQRQLSGAFQCVLDRISGREFGERLQKEYDAICHELAKMQKQRATKVKNLVVFQKNLAGLSCEQIASQIGVSKKTIERRVALICDVLGYEPPLTATTP